MNAAYTDSIDTIAISADGKTIELALIEDRPLDSPDLVDQTAAKFATYLNFIDTGQIKESVPDADQLQLEVCYVTVEAPEGHPDLIAVLKNAKRLLAEQGVNLRVQHFNLPA